MYTQLFHKDDVAVGVGAIVACVAGPQFYGGPDLQRAGFWRARGRITGPL
jgi:hypothetical protein